MGDVIDRKPPQWQKKAPVEVDEDAMILRLASAVLRTLTDEVVPTQAQIAVLQLVKRAVLGNYLAATPSASAREVLSQANALARNYSVMGADGQSYD